VGLDQEVSPMAADIPDASAHHHAARPRLSATVLLLRERDGVEVLLIHRSADMHYMGGVWAFPGGKLDAEDCSPAALGRIAPTGACPLVRSEALSHAQALGLHVATCRETFEEVGLLLARRLEGGACSAESGRRAGAFVEMLEREKLYLVADDLVPWANWITPSASPKRFDTWFFVAAAPDEQLVTVNPTESTRHLWLAPEAALAACERGEMRLAPPTQLTLRDVAASFARHASLAALLRAERTRATPPVLPRVRIDVAGREAVMPWDPGYAALDGESVPPGTRYPDWMRQLPSRVWTPRVAAGPG
jgi:8-oxo-dGTP pyrophosphatase MutT (NUDIX family)